MVEEPASKLARRQLDEPPPGDLRLASVLDAAQIFARWLKFVLQLAAGLSIMALLVLKVMLAVSIPIPFAASLQPLLERQILEIVAQGLMFSAGIELAYMLFTPGPDEAIEPVILGVAAAILLVVSGDVTIASAVSIGILCISMALLFWVRRRYVADTVDAPIARAPELPSSPKRPRKLGLKPTQLQHGADGPSTEQATR